jgi:hypothetical protein
MTCRERVADFYRSYHMEFMLEDILNARELTDAEKAHYKKAQPKAKKCKAKAEEREDIDGGLIRTRVGNDYYVSIPEKPDTDYWSGFLNGLEGRILFQLDNGSIASALKDVPMSETFRGYIAGYMLLELSSNAQNEYAPRKVQPPDCEPIVY